MIKQGVNYAKKILNYRTWEGKHLSLSSGRKHREIDIKIKAFFNPKKNELVQNTENECKTFIIESSSGSSKIQATIELAINNVEHTKSRNTLDLRSL